MKIKAFLFIELSIAMTLCALTILSVMGWYGKVVHRYAKGTAIVRALEHGLWEIEDIHSNKPRSSYQKKCDTYSIVCTVMPRLHEYYYPVDVAVYDPTTSDSAIINLSTGFCV